MNPVTHTADMLREQANELYWNSTETVGELGRRLGMSRNAVYSSVQPAPVGIPCATCGEPLYFSNRSSRAAGRATCLSCQTEVTVDTADLVPPTSTKTEEAQDEPVEGRLSRLKEDLGAVSPERAAKIGGAAVLGAALGAAAAKIIRKK